MADKPLPPKVLNKLFRWPEPHDIPLEGPGAFRLPLLVRVESILGGTPLEIRLETESGQEVRLHLTESAAGVLRSLLTVEMKRREGA